MCRSASAALHNLTWIELEDNEILDFSSLDAFPESVAIIKSNNPGFIREAEENRGSLAVGDRADGALTGFNRRGLWTRFPIRGERTENDGKADSDTGRDRRGI